MRTTDKLIFQHSRPGRRAHAQAPADVPDPDLPQHLLRTSPPRLPEVSELQVVRHYTRLSQRNFSIDTHMYPLGSCTMKYNPRACNALAMLPELLGRHPLGPESHGQGLLECLWELQEILRAVTGMKGVSLTPMAGAQGELAGVAMMRAYHLARGDAHRVEIIDVVPADMKVRASYMNSERLGQFMDPSQPTRPSSGRKFQFKGWGGSASTTSQRVDVDVKTDTTLTARFDVQEAPQTQPATSPR